MKLKYLIFGITIIFLTNCGLPINTYKPKESFENITTPKAPDYSKTKYWAALPTKKDNADRTPNDSLKDNQKNALVDVFYVYPTIYTGTKSYQKGWNADVNDTIFNQAIDESAILHQASAFNAAGKIYIPRYRQGHMYIYFAKDTASATKAYNLAYDDVKAAFEYYMKHYNNGRPIIIAAHSQGTNHCEQLLKDFFDNKPLQNQLVAAYLVGMPLHRGTFKTIYPCRNASETGCFCSWNTYASDYFPKNYHKKLYNAVATNPINWTTDGTPADYSENKGGLMPDFTIAPNASNAKSVRGMLWIDKLNINVPAPFLIKKNWHIADYNLFWMNIRENAVLRTTQFIDNQ
ncbi:MAG: DUF3089 domain-containing protein [Saprospiraceae bacterium]